MESKPLNVHSIESFGTQDGPGIRMVVFLQGCNIRCKYCQNADTISLEGGTLTPIDDLVKRAVNMKPYFKNIGGVTVSGGEPLLQADALIPFFKALNAEGINTNVDTNGTVTTEAAKKIISEVSDLVMFDVKHTTVEGFEALVKARGLKKVIENIELREQSGKPYWLRYVLVPGITDSDESLEWLAQTFGNNKHLDRLEILPFHKLGEHKWEMLGEKYELQDQEENTQENLDRVEAYLSKTFKNLVIK